MWNAVKLLQGVNMESGLMQWRWCSFVSACGRPLSRVGQTRLTSSLAQCRRAILRAAQSYMF